MLFSQIEHRMAQASLPKIAEDLQFAESLSCNVQTKYYS